MEKAKFINPLEEERGNKIPESCILVIFGATGDLTARKLVPALYNLAKEGQLPSHFACVGFARREKDHAKFREEMKEAVSEFSRTKPLDEEVWNHFSEHLYYHRSEFDQDEGYESLKDFLKNLDNQLGTKGNRVFYLSTQPKFFSLVIEKLDAHGLIYKEEEENEKFSRVIIEKPFGRDLNTALRLQADIAKHLNENQTYRIDHYLGKETVQNLLVFRFGNPFFESVWNKKAIDHVQITVAEELGIGTRGKFFEEEGLLRDIVQNHMMQLLSLVAMEPPINMSADAIRDEKVKAVQSIRLFTKEEITSEIIRGQYGKGFINGKEVPGYREEENVSKTSNIETFAALKLSIDNWRWAGVPFYLRAGKRLPKRSTEIAIVFKEAPGFLFQKNGKKLESNVLVIRIQPNEGSSIKMNCKVPGLSTTIQPVKMNFLYGSFFGSTPEAYERLICDCMAGDNTLFAREDEVMASWKLYTPLLEYWEKTKVSDFPNYEAGTWGPEASKKLLEKDEREWRLL